MLERFSAWGLSLLATGCFLAYALALAHAFAHRGGWHLGGLRLVLLLVASRAIAILRWRAEQFGHVEDGETRTA